MITLLIITILAFILFFLYSACILSGKCSRMEEKYEFMRNVQKITERR